MGPMGPIYNGADDNASGAAVLLGILPAMVRPLKEHKESLENLRQKFGDLILPEIPSRAAVAECPAYAQTIFEHDPENDASAAYMQLVDIVIKASR
jgi:cellulose biosynthesis protein BcsQ